MKIEANKVVQMHYHLTEEAGTVLDSSQGRKPLSFRYMEPETLLLALKSSWRASSLKLCILVIGSVYIINH